SIRTNVVPIFNAKHWAARLKGWPTALTIKALSDPGVASAGLVGHDLDLTPALMRQVHAQKLVLIRCWGGRLDKRVPLHAVAECWARGHPVAPETLVAVQELSADAPVSALVRTGFWASSVKKVEERAVN